MKEFWQRNWQKLILALIVISALVVAIYSSTFNSLPQASYSLFDPVAQPTASDRVLVVSPHPDDETLGAGDFIQQSLAAGAKVEIVFATDGNKHGKKALRHDEAVKADGKLGVSSDQIIFFDRPDGQLAETDQYNQFVGQLTLAIKSFQPTIIITTLLEDQHADHAACGRAVRSLTPDVTTAQKWYFLVHFERYPRPIGDKPTAYLLPPLELMVNYNWQIFAPTKPQQAQKRLALDTYQSQLSLVNPILRQLVFSFDRQNELFAQAR